MTIDFCPTLLGCFASVSRLRFNAFPSCRRRLLNKPIADEQEEPEQTLWYGMKKEECRCLFMHAGCRLAFTAAAGAAAPLDESLLN
jgi:hypothetical protein